METSAGSSVRRRLQVNYNQASEDAGLESRFFAKTTPSLLTRLSSAVATEEAPGLSISSLEIPDGDSDTSLLRFRQALGPVVSPVRGFGPTRGVAVFNHRSELDQRQWEQIVEFARNPARELLGQRSLPSDYPVRPAYEAYFRTCKREGFHEGHDRAMVVARHLFIPQDVFGKHDQIWPLAVAGLAAHSAEPPTVLHSDVHRGNWYVTEDGKMGLCDWQSISPRPLGTRYILRPLHDYEYRGPTAHERALLLRYLDKLGG